MKITLRQMQVFDAVATLGSVTKAATQLGMSQGAASSALADLQIILRRSLFVHARGRPLQITDEGKRLHPIVRSLLGQAQDVELSNPEQPIRGRIVVGATAMIAETMLPRLCVEFMQAHPEVQVQIEVEPVRGLVDRLSRFELETALIEMLPNIDGIELTPWCTDELVLVVAAGHPLASCSGVAMADLAGHKWCTREANSYTTIRLHEMLQGELSELPISFQATSNWAVRHAVIAGGGIGCLSRALVQFDLDNGRLVQLNVPGFSYTRRLSIARLRDVWRSRLTQAFDAFLIQRGDIHGSLAPGLS